MRNPKKGPHYQGGATNKPGRDGKINLTQKASVLSRMRKSQEKRYSDNLMKKVSDNFSRGTKQQRSQNTRQLQWSTEQKLRKTKNALNAHIANVKKENRKRTSPAEKFSRKMGLK